ncbi:MAG: PKD domain-containing protein, partial [Methanobacteriota archaeon]
MEETSRISTLLITAMFMTSIVAVATPSPFDIEIPDGEVTMSTDRDCYFPGELVYITATGWAYVPTIGDFPSIFWAITEESGEPVFETRNMLDAVGSFNGTLDGTWDQKYRFFDGEPPNGEQVPSGTYMIWFYELPGIHEPKIEVFPAKILIGDCPTEVTADAGGPYEVGEGQPILFNASGSEGPWGASLEYRWDFDGDEIWDTSFSDSPIAKHTWSDDYNGTAYVQVKSLAAIPADIEIIGNLDNYTQVDMWSMQAQSFVATFDRITHVTVDVSRFANIIPDYPLVLSVKSELHSPDLTSVSVTGESMPGHMVENWVLFDIPDMNVTPGNTYYIVLTSLASNTAYEPHLTWDVYPDGSQWTTGFCGVWVEVGDYDIRMIVSGTGGEVSDTAEALVTVHNLEPSIDVLPSTVNLYEGDPLHLFVNATDPGSDDFTVTWTWEMGLTQVTEFSNDGSFPFTIADSSSHTYGDDGEFLVDLLVEDDDGGSVTHEVRVEVINVAPSLSIEVIPSGNEGETLTFQVQATDPGSDDITYVWWGHCSGWSESPVL